jgi:predicted secreted Zn-dependent protease
MPHLVPDPLNWLHRAAVFACVAMSCLSANAEVVESLEYKYYTVESHWYEPLARSVIKASPVREGDKSFMGHTAWTVRWDMSWQQEGSGRCAMGQVRTYLHSVITLPQASLSNPQEQTRFDTFLAALRAHELDHVAIARDAARAIGQRLMSLPPMATCQELESVANALGQKELETARRRGVEYDVETGHGKTQGAVLN